MVPNVPLSSPNISIIIPVGPGRGARTALGSLAAAAGSVFAGLADCLGTATMVCASACRA